ncbi:M1 family metallopeptidase [Parvularcula marina]|uniref:Aminopeptidase N n=1 Tax=Parvularcula marina TaxID=2292771 RepID=A0A371RL36_9PROT|nr:M1 family metallopeptidase [Parvularcula marina]RFB06168.1 M1 family peptidase [Parvularcula marina]
MTFDLASPFSTFRAAPLIGGLILLAGCGGGGEPETLSTEEVSVVKTEAEAFHATDKFTYANTDDVIITHLHLDLAIDFDAKVLSGDAVIDLKWLNDEATQVILDTNDLTISDVSYEKDGEWVSTGMELGEDDPLLGSQLTIEAAEHPTKLKISYQTSPGAQGLGWLSAETTANKTAPFLYSQAQTINARSIAPLQDTPMVRMTYSAHLTTPPDVLAIMSAEQDPNTPKDGDYTFSMPQPIPSYLIAIAAGDIDFAPISDNIGVYAEPGVVEKAAWEFAETPDMMTAAEGTYGPYRWGRYDLIVLPPSFPFGGMENPRLSFMTPTLLAGDKSLTNVVAHELAHSWSGNLVTNATWRDAWLNEGFTSYVENRLMELVYGEDRAVMEQVLGLQDLKRDVAELEPELTSLKMPKDLANPDDAFSQVSYVKGQYFLMFLEQRFGREDFDAFLKEYFDKFAFQSITTEVFLDHFRKTLWAAHPEAVTDEEIQEWVYGTGLPDTLIEPVSPAFDLVDETRTEWLAGDLALSDIPTADWTTHEWLHFLGGLPEDMTMEQFTELDETFGLSGHQNAEIAYAWYMKAIAANYEPAYPALEEFLLRVGRGKFIYRLYQALEDNGKGEWAREVYAKARPGYHPIAQTRIDGILGL